LQEEENMDLASRNTHLQQRIAELEALAEAAEAAAQAQQQQRDEASPEPSTPQHQRMRALGICDEGASMQERATSVLKRAAAASRLSGMFEVSDHVPWWSLCTCRHAAFEVRLLLQQAAVGMSVEAWTHASTVLLLSLGLVYLSGLALVLLALQAV
jgi:hypothetical protein